MKIPMDTILQDIAQQAYESTRLGRMGDLTARDPAFAEVLAELEIAGDAMRYLDRKGRIAWKATRKLRDYLEDLETDAMLEAQEEDA